MHLNFDGRSVEIKMGGWREIHWEQMLVLVLVAEEVLIYRIQEVTFLVNTLH